MTDTPQWEPPAAVIEAHGRAIADAESKWYNVPAHRGKRFETDREVYEYVSRAALLASPLPECVAVLREIAAGKGAYSRDRLEHASNCIEEMKALANAMLAKLEGKEPTDENR